MTFAGNRATKKNLRLLFPRQPIPAYSSDGPTGGIARVLDEMGVLRDMQVERRTDGTMARFSYHVPDSSQPCKLEWADAGTNFDTAASGVSSQWDTTGSQTRQLTINVTSGVSYDYRMRCEFTAGALRGSF